MIISRDALNSMLKPNFTEWREYYNQIRLYDAGEKVTLNDKPEHNNSLKNIFEHDFPLFLSPYLSPESDKSDNNIVKKYLRTLTLGGELRREFELALKNPVSSKKLVNLDSQKKLKNAFERCLEHNSLSLKESHYQALVDASGFPSDLSDSDNTQAKAKMLFCLAAVFAKFASSDIFGTELNSPLEIQKICLCFTEKGT